MDALLPGADEPDEGVRTIVRPDLLVVCDRNKITRTGVRGAPDLVIEILSPSTACKDQVTKFHIYEKHGVWEYWIVHPEEQLSRCSCWATTAATGSRFSGKWTGCRLFTCCRGWRSI